MLDPSKLDDPVPPTDVSHIVTEDDTPVDNVFSEKQMRLLADQLYASWNPGRPFAVFANVGLFSSPDEPPVVPDVMVSLDVTVPADIKEKKHRSYFIWVYNKPPEVAIEIVSNREGGEEAKLQRYASMGVAYAVLYDPEAFLSSRTFRAYELHGRHYVDLVQPAWLPDAGVGLTVWHGDFENVEADWLRWCDREGRLLLTGAEAAVLAEQRAETERQRADTERHRADTERHRADTEQQRADSERQRADQLAERLRQMGEEV